VRLDIKPMMTSKRADWGTPRDFYRWVEAAFGGFTVDVCANERNHKHRRYFDKRADGLAQSWRGETFWDNPEYGDQAPRWLDKSRHESVHNGAAGANLIASRVDTDWFRDATTHVRGAGKMRSSFFVQETGVLWLRYAGLRVGVYHHDQRITFEGAKTGAPFPSSVIIHVANGRVLKPDARVTLDGRPVLTLGMPR
jgi:DNA N-6-adenine-methyltransferase (Dam)